MKQDSHEVIETIFAKIKGMQHMDPSDIPNISLYMDQVTTLMDEKLSVSKRSVDDKILTKTMINNYAKNNLLPPPMKKKYEKEHVLVLIFIYYFKNILSIKDIESLLQPITTNYFSHGEEFNINDIYEEVLKLEQGSIDSIQASVLDSFKRTQDSFTDLDDPEQDFLQIFSFICILSFDIYIKKRIIEQLIDSYPMESLIPEADKKQKDK